MLNKNPFWILMFSILAITLFIPKNLEATIYGSICGKVIAGDTGMPLSNAQIMLYSHHPKYGISNPNYTFTDKEGNFCFEMLGEGRYYLTYIPQHPYLGNDELFTVEYVIKKNYNWPSTVILEKGKNVNIDIVADQIGGSISGRVLKGDGVTPFPEVNVNASSSEGNQSGDRSKEDGSYRITHLMPADNYRVELQLPGYGEKRITEIRVEANKDTSGIDIIVNTDDPTGVEGTVTASDGKPLEGKIVGVFRTDKYGTGWNFTDKDGKYSISGLEPGIYKIRIGYTMKIIDRPKEKIIEGVVVEKGKTTRVDIVLDSSLNAQSGWKEEKGNNQYRNCN